MGTYSTTRASEILQTNEKKLEKSIFPVLFLKTFKDVKFTVDGSAFETFITPSTKNYCLMLADYDYERKVVQQLCEKQHVAWK